MHSHDEMEMKKDGIHATALKMCSFNLNVKYGTMKDVLQTRYKLGQKERYES